MLKRIYFSYLGVILILSVFYTNYILKRELGESSYLVLFLKIAAMVLILMGTFNPKEKPSVHESNYVVIMILAFMSYLIGTGLYNNCDQIFLNSIIQLPLFFMGISNNNYKKIFDLIVSVAIIQILIDFYIQYSGFSLRLSAAFEGGFGNPSSFGVFLNICIAYVLFEKKLGLKNWIIVSLLSLGSVLTLSLFTSISLAFVFLYFLKVNRIVSIAGILKFSFILACIGFCYNYFSEYFDTIKFGFLENKLNSLLGYLGVINYDASNSLSVSVREKIVFETYHGFITYRNILFGHIYDCNYWRVDNQMLSYIGSFGIIWFTLFIVVLVKMIKKVLRGENNFFPRIGLLLIFIILFTNRILEYFPILFLVILMFKISLNKKRI